jgi:hypothetical protein
MEDQIIELINTKKKLFLKNKKYILDNNWTDKKSTVKKTKNKDDYADYLLQIKYKKKEFDFQNELVKGMLQHINRFLKKIKGVDVSENTQSFLDEGLEIIELHIDRVDEYVDNIDVNEIQNDDIKSDELKFHNEISKEVELIQDLITTYGLRNSKTADTSTIAFLNDVRVPLSMLWVLMDLYPDIRKKVEEKGIDFETPPKNEMLIYMDDTPVWDEKLHAYDQKIETLQFLSLIHI